MNIPKSTHATIQVHTYADDSISTRAYEPGVHPGFTAIEIGLDVSIFVSNESVALALIAAATAALDNARTWGQTD